MYTRSLLLRVWLIASLALVAATPSAFARRLNIDDQDFQATWSPASFIAGGTTATCSVTLAGSFHSATQTKSIGSLIGYITSASAGSCSGGTAMTILAGTLPWHVSYGGFSGTLPTISAVTLNVIGSAIEFDPAGALPSCLFRSDAAEPFRLRLTVANGTISGLTFDPTASIDLEEDRFLGSIGGDIELEGVGALADEASSTTNRLQATPAGEIDLESLGAIRFAGGELSMTCEWTLSGSLRSETLTIEEGTTIGSVSSATADHCGGGSIERVLSTPWSLKYVRATGTIPGSVTAVTLKVEGYAVTLASFGSNVGCLYRGDLTGTLELSGANPYPTGLFTLAEPRLTKVSGPGGCPSTITATGTYWLGPEQQLRFEQITTGNPLTIRLVA